MINVALITAEIGSFQPNDHVEYYPWFTPNPFPEEDGPAGPVHSDLEVNLDMWWDVSTEDIGCVYEYKTGIIQCYDDYTQHKTQMRNELVECVSFGDF